MRHYKPVIFDGPLAEGTPPGALTISIIDDGLPFDPEHRCDDACFQKAVLNIETSDV